jgi:hypothetical protein
MDIEDYWAELKGDVWCVYHKSMDKPIICFPKLKKAEAWIKKEVEKFTKDKK